MIVDYGNWCVSNGYFHEIDSRSGSFTVDCFASYANTKLPRLYSIFYSPVALGVDAVSHSWKSCWLVAPVCHALQVFELFKYCKCVGALFWACDINEDRSFSSDVVEFLYVAKGKRIFGHVAIKNCSIGSDKF